jgi:hypothetical protein
MSQSPQTVGLLLIPGFALMSYASVVAPLRAANLLAEKELYRWIHVSPGPAAVSASSGASVPCTARAGDALKLDLLLVCAGGTFALPAADGGEVSGFPECSGGDGATAYKRVTVREAAERNHNPRFADVALDGVPLGSEPLALPACAEGECRARTLTAVATPESVETFIEIAFGEPVERQEGVYVSWFATSGSFERIRSGVDNLEVGWTPPAGPATVDFWFVLHDGRGGTDWRSARVVLVGD